MTSVVPTPEPEIAASAEPAALIVQGLVAPGVTAAAVVETRVVEPVEVQDDVVSPVAAVAELRRLVRGPVYGPHDVGTVTELAVTGAVGARAPLAVVGAIASSDVAAVVAWAARLRVPVEVVDTGRESWSDDSVVVTTRRMDRVVVDPDTATAWVGAGVTWRQLLHAAADVGVVGPVSPDDDRSVVGALVAGERSGVVRVARRTVVTPHGRVVDSGHATTDGIVTEMEIALRV